MKIPLILRSRHYQLPGATQDVLTKAKAALASSVLEIESLKKQLVEKVSENINASSTSEVLQLARELSSASDETVALKEVLQSQHERVVTGLRVVYRMWRSVHRWKTNVLKQTKKRKTTRFLGT